jgi:hypothetical protein
VLHFSTLLWIENFEAKMKIFIKTVFLFLNQIKYYAIMLLQFNITGKIVDKETTQLTPNGGRIFTTGILVIKKPRGLRNQSKMNPQL